MTRAEVFRSWACDLGNLSFDPVHWWQHLSFSQAAVLLLCAVFLTLGLIRLGK
jgi:hypothetical protein